MLDDDGNDMCIWFLSTHIKRMGGAFTLGIISDGFFLCTLL